MLIFKASFYKENNKKLKLDMATEKQQFYSDSLFYNQLQNILDFYQKNTHIWRVQIWSGSFAVIPKYFAQMEQYCARLSHAYKFSNAPLNSEIAASHFEKCFKCVLKDFHNQKFNHQSSNSRLVDLSKDPLFMPLDQVTCG